MRIGTFLAGLVLIIIGLIIFLANIGYGSWTFVEQLYRFWPVLLILIGISIFWGGVMPRWLGILLIIALSGGIVVLAIQNPTSSFDLSQGQRETTLVVDRSRYEGVTSGEVEMKFGGGKVLLDSETEQLVEGLFRGAAGAATSVDRYNNEIKIFIRQAEGIWYPQRHFINDWKVHLSPNLPWKITMDAGAAEGDLDFTDLEIQQLNAKLGAGDFRFKFGNNGEYGEVKMQAGASNVRVEVDGETGIRIRVKGALANTNLDELGWPIVDNYYVSPGYEEALSRIDLDLEVAVGNFEVDVLSPQGIQL